MNHQRKHLYNLALLFIIIIGQIFTIILYLGETCVDFNENKNLYNLNTSNSDINLHIPENNTYNKDSGYFLNSYDFEDLAEFDDIYGTLSEIDNHKNVLKIRYGFSYSIENQFSRTYGTIEFYFRTEDATDKTIMSLKGIETTPHIYFYVMNDDWYFLDNDTFKTIDLMGNYKPLDNKWHHVRIDFETTLGSYVGLAQDKWRLTVDSYPSQDLNIHREENPPPCIIDKIWLASYVDQPNGSSYFDAFSYSWDPFYSIGDNLDQGIYLNFETSINLVWMWYSLDNQPTKIIPGNTTISMPDYGTHSIQIFGNDTIGTVYQSSKIYFTVGEINILSPNKNSVWEESLTYYITWSSSYNITYIDIEMYKGTTLEYFDYGINNTGTYSWTIPEGISIGNDWKIKVIDSDNASIYGVSEFFEIITAINIINPNDQSIWYSGKPYSITWTSRGNITHIDIEIYKNAVLQYSLVNGTPNFGRYTWLIPFTIQAGSDWTVKIIDANNTLIFSESDEFEIYTTKSITITNPRLSTHWERGTNQYITWTYTGEILNVDIEIYKDTDLRYTFLGTENDEAKYWEIPEDEEIGSDWNVKIIDSDNSSVYDESENFEIYEHPDILVTSPSKTSRWEPDKAYFITWSVSARSNISYVDIDIYKSLALYYSIAQTENDGKYLWNIPYDPPPGDDWYIKITDSDNASVTAWSNTFEIFTDKSISIIYPIGTDDLPIARNSLISWSSTGSISYVNIDFFKGNNLNNARFSVNMTENDGSYNLYFPYYEIPGDDWRMRISASDYLGVNDLTNYFSAHIVRTVTVLAPNKSTTMLIGDYYDIVWNTNGTIPYLKIDLYREDEYVTTITSQTNNDGRFLWHIITNFPKSNKYSIRISDASDNNVFDFGDEYFEINAGSIPGYNILIFSFFVSLITIIIIIRKKKEKNN